MLLEDIVKFLIKENITIATMESCTGGLLASMITDIEGASAILKFSAVTYASEYKTYMGVKEETIVKYTVYSKEVVEEMAYNIVKVANSDIGVGISGQLSGNDKGVYLCIYDSKNEKYYHKYIDITNNIRTEEKLEVIKAFKDLFNSTIKA